MTGARVRFGWWAVVAAVVLVALPWVGPQPVSWEHVARRLRGEESVQATIFFSLRLPRVVAAMAVGGSLAVAGACLQVLFRNPLAEPWTLGVSGGAALGAFAAHVAWAGGLAAWVGGTQACALVGAGAVMVAVWELFRRRRHVSVLLLAGVTMSVFSGGIIALSLSFVDPSQFLSFHRWTMGGLDVVGFASLWPLLVLGLPGLWLMGSLAREYDHISFDQDLAMGQGVDLAMVYRRTFVGAGLVTAACVAVAGPIGFVGMITPHAVRALSGYRHRTVLPSCFCVGGTILALCDAAARTLAAPREIPVGVATTVLGAPLFLWLLARRGQGSVR